MRKVLLFFWLWILSTVAFADAFKVSDVRIEGLQRVSASPVFAALPVQTGDIADAEVVRSTIRALFKTGFFANVQVARDGDVLIVILKEFPAIKSVTFDGNKAIKTDQLNEIFLDNGLSEGEILQQHKLEGITRELGRQYISQGRYSASVKTEIKDLPNNMVDIEVLVDEGKAAKIRHINIVGNNTFDDKKLMDDFEQRESVWWKFFSSSDKYTKEKLTGDIETLESFYLDRGYLDFKILSSQISVSPDKRSVFITLNISEGDVYTVGSVDIAGDPIVSEARARSLILLANGDVYSQARVTATTEYMTTLLSNIGYTNAKVESNPIKQEGDERKVDLTFFIDPGKRVYVRRVEFKGNTQTKDEVLRREMRQLEGSSASNARIEQSKVRLERLGFFKEVNVETVDVPGSEDLVDVVYEVEEQPSGTINASLTYAQSTGLGVGLNVEQTNWLGTGKRVDFGVQQNSYQTVYSFNYNDPYFTPDGVSRGFTAFYRTRDYEKINVTSYTTDSHGVEVNFGYPISEISRLGASFGWVHQSVETGIYAPQEIKGSPFIYDYSSLVYVRQSDLQQAFIGSFAGNGSIGTAPPQVEGEYQEFSVPTYSVTEDMLFETEPGFLDENGDSFNTARFGLNWTRMTLNRGILATRGSSQRLNLLATVPGSELEYYKLTYDAQAFMPVTRKLTLRFKTTLGYGNGYGDMDELPFFENFYAGGFGSVRGYERSTLGPKASPAVHYQTVYSSWEDIDGDGSYYDREELGPNTAGSNSRGAYVLCEDPYAQGLTTFPCVPGKLDIESRSYPNKNAFGGNILVELGTELILPLPSNSTQLVLFVDSGNAFSDNCRETQANCYRFDLGELKSSYGVGFTWISPMGPMTFSYAIPIDRVTQQDVQDDPTRSADLVERFQFTFGAGF